MLLRAVLRKPTIARLDALLDIIVLPQSLLVMLILACMAASVLLHPLAVVYFGACLLAVAFCILSALSLTRAPVSIWLALAAVPFLLLWKMPVYARLLFTRGAQAWQRTPRDTELSEKDKQ